MHYDVPAWLKTQDERGGIAVVKLDAGDTATNYASTKGPLVGPLVVAYEIRRSGISAWLFDTGIHQHPSWVADALVPGELAWVPPITNAPTDDHPGHHNECARRSGERCDCGVG